VDGGDGEDAAGLLRAIGGEAARGKDDSGVDGGSGDAIPPQCERAERDEGVFNGQKEFGGPKRLSIALTAGDKDSAISGNEECERVSTRRDERTGWFPCIRRGTEDLGSVGLLHSIGTAGSQDAAVVEPDGEMPSARRGHRRTRDEAEILGIEDLGGGEGAGCAQAADQHDAPIGERYGGVLGPRFEQRGIGTDEGVGSGIEDLDGIERTVDAVTTGDQHLAAGQQSGGVAAPRFARSGDELPSDGSGIENFGGSSGVHVASHGQYPAVVEESAGVPGARGGHRRSWNEGALRQIDFGGCEGAQDSGTTGDQDAAVREANSTTLTPGF